MDLALEDLVHVIVGWLHDGRFYLLLFIVATGARAAWAFRPRPRPRKRGPMSSEDFQRFSAEVRRRNAPFEAALAQRPLPDFQSVRNAFNAHGQNLQILANLQGETSWQHAVSSRVRADAAYETAIRGNPRKALRQLESLAAWLKRNPGVSDGLRTRDGFQRLAPPMNLAVVYAGAGAIGYLIDDATAARYYALAHAEDGGDPGVALMLAVLLLRLGRRPDARRVIAPLIEVYGVALARAEKDYEAHRGRGPWESLEDARRDMEAAQTLLAQAADPDAALIPA